VCVCGEGRTVQELRCVKRHEIEQHMPELRLVVRLYTSAPDGALLCRRRPSFPVADDDPRDSAGQRAADGCALSKHQLRLVIDKRTPTTDSIFDVPLADFRI
jgi:hypothetical protein